LGFQIESSESKSYITNQEGRDDESFTRKKEDSPQCNLNFIGFLETEQRCHRENCTCQIDTCITWWSFLIKNILKWYIFIFYFILKASI
jgi:hypothetical protein